MYQQKKWIIWLSIFLSLLWCSDSRLAAPVTQTAGKASVNYKPKPIAYPIEDKAIPVETTTLTTTTLRPKTTTTVPQTAPVGDCGPRKMLKGQAHACWDSLIAQYDWPFSTAFNVMYCESTANYEAKAGSHYGLFQIDGGSTNPEDNVAQAYSMYKERGWQPWDASAGCW